MKNNKYVLIFITILILSVVYFSAQLKSSEGVIKVGYIGPLTGEAAPYGQSVLDGINLAVKKAEKDGIFKPGQIQIVAEDGQCVGKSAITAVEKLIKIDGVRVIFGGQCSGETMAIAPIVENNKVLLFSSFSTSPDVTNAGDYVFRLPPSDVIAGEYIAKTIYTDKNETVGMVSENTQASQTIIPVFKNVLNILGVNLAVEEMFNSDTKDFRQIASNIISKNPEALYLNVQTGGNGARIVKSLRELGYKNQIYTYYITGDEFVKSGEYVNGIKIIDFKAALDSKALENFSIMFNEKYSRNPFYPMAATLGYDSGMIIIEGIKKVGDNPDSLKNYLYNMKKYEGVTGNIVFDKNGDSSGTGLYYVRQIVDNKLVDLN